MKTNMLIAVMLLATQANASAYLDYIGKKNVPVYMSDGFDITPRDVGQTSMVHNIGLITHDKKNGSICNSLNLGSWCVPESWVPLQATFGGSVTGGLVAGFGSSFNAMPQLASLAMAGVDKGSQQWLQSVKTVLTQDDPTKTNVRVGLDFSGSITQDGHWVPMNQAFPGRGPLAILENSAKLNIGLAW